MLSKEFIDKCRILQIKQNSKLQEHGYKGKDKNRYKMAPNLWTDYTLVNTNLREQLSVLNDISSHL